LCLFKFRVLLFIYLLIFFYTYNSPTSPYIFEPVPGRRRSARSRRRRNRRKSAIGWKKPSCFCPSSPPLSTSSIRRRCVNCTLIMDCLGHYYRTLSTLIWLHLSYRDQYTTRRADHFSRPTIVSRATKENLVEKNIVTYIYIYISTHMYSFRQQAAEFKGVASYKTK
jgi:hypothetical protein